MNLIELWLVCSDLESVDSSVPKAEAKSTKHGYTAMLFTAAFRSENKLVLQNICNNKF